MSRLRFAAWPAVIAVVVAFFYSGLVFRGLIIGDYDAFVYFYPLREYAAHALSQGEFPLWNPYTFMGAPFFANVQTAVLYPPNLLFVLLPTPYAFSASVVGHVVLAAAGMYLFCRRVLGVGSLAGVMGAVAFALSGFMSFQVSHINQLSVSAWLPMLLLAFDRAVLKRSLWMAVVVGLIGTLQLLAGHTQEWYFSTAALGLFAIWRILAPANGSHRHGKTDQTGPVDRATSWPARLWLHVPRLYPMVLVLAAGVVEVGLSAIQWMPTMELSGESIRGGGMPYGEAVSFSLPPTTALYTLLPAYPSTLFSEYVGYVGIIPLVLAVIAVARWRVRPATLFMAALTIFGLFMAFGGYNPLSPLLYRFVPGLDLFRVPARWLLVYTLGVAGLAALGAQALVDGRSLLDRALAEAGEPVSRQHLLVSATLLGCAAGMLGLLGLLARPAPQRGVVAVWIAIAIGAVALWSAGFLVSRLRYPAMLLLIVGTCLELWMAGSNAVYRHPVPASAYAPVRSSTSFIQEGLKKDEVPERVLSIASSDYEVKETPDYKKAYSWLEQKALTDYLVDVKLSETLSPNLPMEYGIQTPDGYDGGVLPLKRYGDLKALMVPPEGAAPDVPLRNNMAYVPSKRFLDLMGVKYVLAAKIEDAKVENVYYDRGVSVDLAAGQTRTLNRITDIQATSVGVISSTLGARLLQDGTQAGTLVVKDDAGKSYELPLRLGIETAETALEDAQSPPPAHKRPQEAPVWPPGTKDTDYFVKIRLPSRMRIKQVTIKGLLPDASLRIRAITLIDDVAALVAPLTLSDSLDRETFFDMKVYSYRDALPRAFIAYNSAVRDDGLALGELERGDISIRQTAMLAPSPTARSVYRSDSPGFSSSDAHVVSYKPEEVSIDATARDSGYLVLLDAFYPGWVVKVDGKEAPIERVDYMFRGVHLSKGHHSIVFSYSPSTFRTGGLLTVLSFLLLASAFGWKVIYSRRHGVL